MNGEFPISILITQARLSAVFKITTKLNGNFSYSSETGTWPLTLKYSPSSLVNLPAYQLHYQVFNESFHHFINLLVAPFCIRVPGNTIFPLPYHMTLSKPLQTFGPPANYEK